MKKYAAFFDMDKTILSKNSGQLYYKYYYKKGEIGFMDFLKLLPIPILFAFGMLKLEYISRVLSEKYIGLTESEIYKKTQKWFDDFGHKFVREDLVEEIKRHRENNAVIVLISASPRNLCYPLYDYLDMDKLISTDLIIENNIFKGIQGKNVYGDEKVKRANDFLEENDMTFEESYFYSDSISDLPLLDAVGNPICVNPDKKLMKVAINKNWKILEV
ncbi:MAG: HAD family hydrolase [Thermotogota bacterium]